MKILELHLRAFGAFSDFALDLSGGSEGLHIIYGPNEAGKSTARRALTNLFYGIPHLSTDDFRHGRQDLRIAARVRRADLTEFAFTRRKGTKNTLLDFAGAETLPADSLARCLGGVEKSVFETLFCLDHDELVKGSESILQGSGAVGEALFSAGMGGANLRAYLRELDAEADLLFKNKGQNQKINASLKGFRETRDRIRASALSGAAWSELDRQLSDARGQRADLTARRDACRTERERLERLSQALPSLAKRALLQGKIEALGPLPPLPESFPRDRAAAAAEVKAAEAEAEKATQELAEIARRLGEIEVRDDVIGASGAISSLQQGVGAFREDQAALPGRRGELIQLQATAAGSLADLRPGLSMEEAGALRLTVLQREGIRRLAITHAAMHAAESAARETLEKAETYLAQRRLTLEEMPPLPDITSLTAAVRRVQKRGDLEGAFAAARRDAAQAESAARTLAALPPPWKGDSPTDRGALEALARLPMPLEASITRFETDFATAAHRVAQAGEEALRYDHQLADAERALEALQRGVQLPTVADLENARDWRDYGWELVTAAWKEGRQTAGEDPTGFVKEGQTLEEAFADSMAMADDCVDRLRREASRVAQCAALQASGDSIRRRVAEVAANRAAMVAASDELRARWIELWRPCGFEPLSPAEMRAWTSRHEKLQAAVAALARAEEAAALAGKLLDAARAEMLACLPPQEETGAAETLDALFDRAQTNLAEVATQVAKRAHLAHEIEVIETSTRPAAEKKRREAQEGLEKWAADWAVALQSLALERNITPGEAEGVLSRIEGLFDSLARAESHRSEIELRELRVAAFTREVNSLIERLDHAATLQALSPDAVAEQLRNLLRQHELAAAEEETHEARQVDVATALDLALERASAASLTLAGFCHAAGCDTPEQLDAVESRWRQGSALRRSLAELEEQLLNLSAGQPLETLETETRALDADALPGRLDALQAEIKTLDGQIEAAVAEAARAEQTLARYDGQGDAAAAAEDAQSLLAGLRDRAMEYSRLRLAAAVLRREMERYRTENQSPLVRRAGQLFGELTGGSFAGLCVDFDGTDRAVLRGVRQGNGTAETVGVDGMSEGTRDQLYLALRLASLERALESQEPLPLILDDILVNFDDSRARAVLRVLRDFSQSAQVLLFVHHEHLIGLAQEALNGEGLYVHRLVAR